MEKLVFRVPLIDANLCGKVAIHEIGCRDREKKNEEKNAWRPKSAAVIHKKPFYVFKGYFWHQSNYAYEFYMYMYNLNELTMCSKPVLLAGQ